jgi:hypothetical protein
MRLSKNARSLAKILLLFGGFYGDQASVASTAVRVADTNAGVSLIEAGVTTSISELWSFGQSKSVKSAAAQNATADSTFLKASTSAAALGLRQGVEVTTTAELMAEDQDLSIVDTVKTRISATYVVLVSFTSSFSLQLQNFVTISLSTCVWLFLTAVIGFLAFTRPKSAMTI